MRFLSKMEKKKLEYAIGNIDGNPSEESSFIVCVERDKLVLYSSSLRSHKELAEYYKQGENVAGGGKLQVKEGILKLWGEGNNLYSILPDFCYCGPEIMKNFAEELKIHLKKMRRNIGKTEIIKCETRKEGFEKILIEASQNWDKTGLYKIFKDQFEKKVLCISGGEFKREEPQPDFWGLDNFYGCSSNKALECLKSKSYGAVVISDRRGRGEGLPVLKDIREKNKSIPIFYVGSSKAKKRFKEFADKYNVTFVSYNMTNTDLAKMIEGR